MSWWHILQHWLAIHTGTVNESGPFYGFWSGFGSDIQEFGVFAVVFTHWKHVNCHAPGCLRIGKHPAADGLFRLCAKHHPDVLDEGPTLARIHQLHRESKQKAA